ncbi:MAG: hypothetical protein ACI4XB_09815 [Ruminococcus sp.]
MYDIIKQTAPGCDNSGSGSLFTDTEKAIQPDKQGKTTETACFSPCLAEKWEPDKVRQPDEQKNRYRIASAAVLFVYRHAVRQSKYQNHNHEVILIPYQPVEEFAAIISSLCVARPWQATACLRLGALIDKMLSGNFFNRTIWD